MKKLFLILLTITLVSSGSLLQSHGFAGGGYGRGGGFGRGVGAAVVAPLAVTGALVGGALGDGYYNDGDYDDGYGYDY